jgi:hypothetical protein
LNFFQKDSNTLTLKYSNTILNKCIVIPEGFKIKISEGQSIDIINNGNIISKSPIVCKGSEENKIKIYSSDSTGQGIHIIQNGKSSSLNYLLFTNQYALLDNPSKSNYRLPSSLTFYEGNVKINNCQFENLKNEDAINLFRCNYTMINSKIKTTFSDAFDADFSNGEINNCEIINCGNDAIDISGGELDLHNSYFSNIKDKAISAGEESIMNIKDCQIKSSSLGLIAKDLSKIKSSNTTISNCEIAYCAFQKKSEYGPGSIFVSQNKVIDCKRNYLIELGSSLIIDDKKIKDSKENVADLLYGNIYGKATEK